MKKINVVIVCAIALVGFCMGISSCSKKTKADVENEVEKAENSKKRSVTVINKTDSKYIKEASLTTENGKMIVDKNFEEFENIVFYDFDEDGTYKNETKFKVILTDRSGLKFEHIFEANAKGNTEVVVTEKDYVKQNGDFLKKIERFANE